MPSDLSNYLATHYLTADPKPSKKRKRKQKDTEGLIIADDDETGWSSRSRNRDGADDEDDDMALQAAVAGTSAEFRKAKKSGWKVLGGSSSTNPQTTSTSTSTPQDTDDATRQADAILASAAAESALAGADADEENAPVMMSDGTYAGLQTGASVSAQLSARRAAERAEYERSAGGTGGGKEAETIYRDATGRRVDVSMKRAELRREAEEAARKREEAELALRGDVQREEAMRRRSALEDAKVMSVARHADDVEMNAEMKAQVRWGDTMAAFVKPKDATTSGVGTKGGGRSVKGRPVYKGAWAPNRYQIPPGHRWDGVDRGNGFEGERFKAINRRERNKDLDYSWQMDE
ncbi:Pre-mRNA-splicing factor of RES complex-domain-containing protein [Xylaria bambusicola]|uniref:Pre-mRNA-splicing factor of RES complex-domain-containing protein n=1 Tax=Xylaria bambusicola TaxID=326684 RepID=UPI0020076CE7|nr:Pre-mRNA-splicing factor of RES complex-domain-containing protein [Xylaria bambusicola]KAI0508667.1 Pre-mRNA-splicing factor of RES complex-domain-containing protein [Xylaria bambusicola]